jgi:hypothetical protein
MDYPTALQAWTELQARCFARLNELAAERKELQNKKGALAYRIAIPTTTYDKWKWSELAEVIATFSKTLPPTDCGPPAPPRLFCGFWTISVTEPQLLTGLEERIATIKKARWKSEIVPAAAKYLDEVKRLPEWTKTTTGPLIPLENRTKPMTLGDVGILLGKESDNKNPIKRRRAASRAMSRSLKNYTHEKVGTKYVFDKNELFLSQEKT